MRKRRPPIMRPKAVLSSLRPECSSEYWIIGAWWVDGRAVLCGPKKFLGVMEDLAGRFLRNASPRVREDRRRARVVVGVSRLVWDEWLGELRRFCSVRHVSRLGRLCG